MEEKHGSILMGTIWMLILSVPLGWLPGPGQQIGGLLA